MDKKINWGILGCANIADYRVVPALLSEVTNGRLYALASRNGGERFDKMVAQYKPEKSYLSYEALLEDPAVDAVYIPLPNALHKEWVIKAADAGKHVLCEKPLGLNSAEVEAMIEAGRRNHVIIMEAFANMHSPLYPAIRELIAQGVIGELRLVNSFFGCPVPEIAGSIHYAKDMGAGSLYNVGSYNILTIREITGREPVSVKAVGRLDARGQDGIDLSHYVVMDLGDGIMGVAQGSHDTAFHRGLEVLGTQGFIHFDRTPNAWGELEIHYTNQQGSFSKKVFAADTYGAELQQFGDCILHGAQPRMSLASSLANTKIYEQIFQEIGLER